MFKHTDFLTKIKKEKKKKTVELQFSSHLETTENSTRSSLNFNTNAVADVFALIKDCHLPNKEIKNARWNCRAVVNIVVKVN